MYEPLYSFGVYFQILTSVRRFRMSINVCRYEQQKLNEVMDQVMVLSYMVDELREEVNALKMSPLVAGNDNVMLKSACDKKKKCHPLKRLKMYFKNKKASNVCSSDNGTDYYRTGYYNRCSNSPLLQSGTSNVVADKSEEYTICSSYPVASKYLPRAQKMKKDFYDKWEPRENTCTTDSCRKSRRNDLNENSRLTQRSVFGQAETELIPETRLSTKKKSVRVPVASNETFDISYSDFRYPAFSENLKSDLNSVEGRPMKGVERTKQSYNVDVQTDLSRPADSLNYPQTFIRNSTCSPESYLETVDFSKKSQRQKRNTVPSKETGALSRPVYWSSKEPTRYERNVTFLDRESIPKNTTQRLQTSSTSITSNNSIEATTVPVFYDEEMVPVSMGRSKTVGTSSQDSTFKQDSELYWTRRPKLENNNCKFGVENKNRTCRHECGNYLRDKGEPTVEAESKRTVKMKSTGTNTNAVLISPEHKNTQTLNDVDLKKQISDRKKLITKTEDATRDFYNQSEYTSNESLLLHSISENNSQSLIYKDLKSNVIDRSKLCPDRGFLSSSTSSRDSSEERNFRKQNVGMARKETNESSTVQKMLSDNESSMQESEKRLPSFLRRPQNMLNRSFEKSVPPLKYQNLEKYRICVSSGRCFSKISPRKGKPKILVCRSVITSFLSSISLSDTLTTFDQKLLDRFYSTHVYPEEPNNGDMSISERKRALFRHVVNYIVSRKFSQFIYNNLSATNLHQFAGLSDQPFGNDCIRNAEYSTTKMLAITEYQSQFSTNSELQIGHAFDNLHACIHKVNDTASKRNRLSYILTL